MKTLRYLKPEEIKVRAIVNNGGVKLSLWKKPQSNLDVIDDSVGIENRSVSYSENGKRCTIAIRSDGEWLSNSGYAFEGSPDLAPNDALNHAGLAWGIGKELYNAPEMFIYKDKLKGFKEGEKADEAPSCKDDFKVTSISFENGAVTSVTIAICTYGTPYAKMVFNKKVSANAQPEAYKPNKEETNGTEPPAIIGEDEVILIGNCKGQTYGQAKETEKFKSFLCWAKTSTTAYSDPKKADQLSRFKELAA